MKKKAQPSVYLAWMLLMLFPIKAISLNLNELLVKETIFRGCDVITSQKSFEKLDSWQLTQVGTHQIKATNLKKKISIEIKIARLKSKVRSINFRFFDQRDKPFFDARVDKRCRILRARLIERGNKNKVLKIISLDNELKNIIEIYDPNPPVPFTLLKNIIRSPTTFTAIIDTGINYTLPVFYQNIAVDRSGNLLGFDFWDNDNFPFDNDPRSNPFYPRHHGTAVFSVISSEAPKSNIAVYRFPADDMCKFKELIDHIAKNKIRVVNLSMGSKSRDEWRCFEKAALNHSNILFIVSAGNDQSNIDVNPLYPASLLLENMIVVTSSDLLGRLGRGSNIGLSSVDFMIPAERVKVIDHRGVKTVSGGTSYAAPRLTALVTRYLEKNSGKSIQDIKQFLISRAIPTTKKTTKYGWIPDPSDNFGIE